MVSRLVLDSPVGLVLGGHLPCLVFRTGLRQVCVWSVRVARLSAFGSVSSDVSMDVSYRTIGSDSARLTPKALCSTNGSVSLSVVECVLVHRTARRADA